MKRLILILIPLVIFSCNSTKQNNTNSIDSTASSIDSNSISSDNTSQTINLSPSFYKHFTGKIGNDDVVLDLIRNKQKLYGMYYKMPNGTTVNFSGQLNSDLTFTLSETAVQGKKTAKFNGKFTTNNTISGISESNNFSFTEDYSQSATFDVYFIEAVDSTDENTYSSDKITFYYPAGKLPSQVANDSLKKQFSHLFFSEKLPISNASEYAKNYKSAFNADYRASLAAGEAFMPWENTAIGDVVYNQNNILTFALHTNSFSGGAHGNYADMFYVFDLATGKKISKDAVFISGSTQKLSKIIYQKIKENRGISDSQMKENYESTAIPVSSNFYITQKGIGFCYNPYEITSYAEGSDDVLVPFSELKSLLTAEIKTQLKL